MRSPETKNAARGAALSETEKAARNRAAIKLALVRCVSLHRAKWRARPTTTATHRAAGDRRCRTHPCSLPASHRLRQGNGCTYCRGQHRRRVGRRAHLTADFSVEAGRRGQHGRGRGGVRRETEATRACVRVRHLPSRTAPIAAFRRGAGKTMRGG